MSSNSTSDTHAAGQTLKITGFLVLALVATGVCGAALYLGGAPFKTQFLSDWFDWFRAEQTWPGVFAVGVVVALIGIIGAIVRMIAGAGAGSRESRSRRRSRSANEVMADVALTVPADDTRDSHKFDAKTFDSRTLAASGLTTPSTSSETLTIAPAEAAFKEPPSVEIQSLEPAIFSDNASDSFLSRNAAQAARTGFDADAALSDTHGLQVSAQVIPIRPDMQVEAPAPTPDPVETALLTETPTGAPRDVPPSDINSVINSAMRFIETPDHAPVQSAPVQSAPVVETPAPEAPAPEMNGFQAVAAAAEPSDDQAVIRQAVQMALSVWPDATRAIAADELGVRVAYLYHDKSQQSANAFHQIASGDLSAAASTLQVQADVLSAVNMKAEAAEMWRVIGALHMGRDDPKALNAYEKVSELDASDANIHLYLARRYIMANEAPARLLPVLQRALTVIGDPATRLELLAPYADLLLKSGEAKAAGDAFEELSRLQETRAYLKPDDVSARSAQGVALARGAQAREMHGAFDQAGPMYKKAHRVFADLSAQMPDHEGLKAMAENALKDAQRFNMA